MATSTLRGKLSLDKIELELLHSARNKSGASLTDIYSPLLGDYSKTTCYQAIKRLGETNFLRLKKVGREYQVYLTRKAKAHLKTLEGEANGS